MLAVDNADRIFVCDQGNDRVQIFTPAGEFVTAFGQRGSDPEQFTGPCGVCVDSIGRILVCDALRVQVFAF